MEENSNGFVTFKKDSFCIEIKTHGNPVEAWQELYRSLLCYIGMECESTSIPHDARFHLTCLLESMLPSWEVSQKMVK